MSIRHRAARHRRDALRLPCFAVHPGFTLLPAFGLFTGMASRPGRAAALLPWADGRVWAGSRLRGGM
jgi:hypothetical protein